MSMVKIALAARDSSVYSEGDWCLSSFHSRGVVQHYTWCNNTTDARVLVSILHTSGEIRSITRLKQIMRIQWHGSSGAFHTNQHTVVTLFATVCF
jgi:hypothetical protein